MQANDESVDARVRRRLRALRAERGLTLQQVAERASLDVSTLSRLESGKRRLALDHIPALAGALGVSADDLLGSAPAPDPRGRGKAWSCGGLTRAPHPHAPAAGGQKAKKSRGGARRRTPPETL